MSGISNSQTLTILIERQPNGEYVAIDEAGRSATARPSAPPSMI